jgi:hypothetical protein
MHQIPGVRTIPACNAVRRGLLHIQEGNFCVWKEIWKEIAFMWKEIERKYCYKEGNEKEILFYLINSKNKTGQAGSSGGGGANCPGPPP